MNRRLLDYIPQMEIPATGHAAAQWQDEETEMAYGAELLAASGAELEALLAELVGEVATDGARLLQSPRGKALLALLTRAARTVLPVHGTELKRRAAAIFGLELEGLSPEDKEFELARHLVRFATDTIRGAEQPDTAVEAALTQSARRHAPGLLQQAAAMPARSGRWQRQGNRILVLNG
jgi:hypothetical protein